jgi:hypothetical protein
MKETLMEHPAFTGNRALRQSYWFMMVMVIILLIGTGSASAADLRAGLAMVDITPPVGWRMYGNFREQFAGSVHDRLFAKAIVLEQGNERVAIVVCDLCFISRKLSEPVRQRASDLTGIPASKIIICATHTHRGPDYDGLLRDLRHERNIREQGNDGHEPIDYLAQLSEGCVKAVVEANKRVRPANLQIVNAQQHGVAFNRRFNMVDGTVRFMPRIKSAFLKVRWLAMSELSLIIVALLPASFFLLCWCIRRLRRPVIAAMVGTGMIGVASLIAFWQGTQFSVSVLSGMPIVSAAGPVDPDLPFLLIRDAANEQVFGGLTVFAMHTTTFGPHQFSGDYPAYLQKRLSERFGEQFVSVFGIGTAGDIGTWDLANGSPQPDSSHVGSVLAATILENFHKLQPLDNPDLKVRSTTVAVPLQDLTDEQIARAREIIGRMDRGAFDMLVIADAWKVMNNERFRRRFGQSLPMEINVVRLSDDTAIVALPHEVFVELGLAIKKQSPFKHTLVVTMAHDIDLYVPTKKAFAEGSYEIIASMIKPGGGEMLVETAVKMLSELKQQADDGNRLPS